MENLINRLYNELINREDYLIHLMSGGYVEKYVDSFYIYNSSNKALLAARVFNDSNIQLLCIGEWEIYCGIYRKEILCNLLIEELKKVMV